MPQSRNCFLTSLPNRIRILIRFWASESNHQACLSLQLGWTALCSCLLFQACALLYEPISSTPTIRAGQKFTAIKWYFIIIKLEYICAQESNKNKKEFWLSSQFICSSASGGIITISNHESWYANISIYIRIWLLPVS